jgi:hypothetical protein
MLKYIQGTDKLKVFVNQQEFGFISVNDGSYFIGRNTMGNAICPTPTDLRKIADKIEEMEQEARIAGSSATNISRL